jgi:glycosyltransferase involved in cell wall biosynthesis
MPDSDKPGPSFAVVIPMLNEEAGAETCVRSVLAALEGFALRCGLIVVDDGSTDATPRILDELSAAGEFTVVHQANGGYGHAIRSGALEAERLGYEYVVFMDSDLTNPPEDIAKFIPEMERSVDVIKGSRFRFGGGMEGVPFKRRVMTGAARVISRSLFRVGVEDCTNGFRAIKTAVTTQMPLTERGFAVILEELYWAKRMGCTFANVPTMLYNRSAEQRPSLFAYNYETIGRYLRYAIKASFARPGAQ